MAEEEEVNLDTKPKGSLPIVVIGAVFVIGVLAILTVVMMKKDEPSVKRRKPAVEYQVGEKMYQLKDGSYLKMSFSIVLDDDKVEQAKMIIEKAAPGRLPHGMNMLVGNKSREDLINGTHKREALAREIKRMLEDRVFREFNQRQKSPEAAIEVREVLINEFVTQSG